VSERFEELADFVGNRMRMSHVYQPVMLVQLLQGRGSATVEDIARAFAAADQSQIEYYAEIVKRMPGPVLSRHGVVERADGSYRLVGFEELTAGEVEMLIGLCRQRLGQYVERRGEAIWQHRSRTSGYISGSLRYEVLKAAQGRCELCGVPAEERFLEVDHIVPRSRGGNDDLTNLQALCYRCNQIKGNRDDTDLRAAATDYGHREPGCVFCDEAEDRAVGGNRLAVAIRDAYPVTPLHTLVIPRRHVTSWADLTRPEAIAVDQLVQATRAAIQAEVPSVTGFNLGVNDGADAGQTIGHAHLHLIPRRPGDTTDPTGGVRGVIPGRQRYR
jgi:ATP adenylyltransferase